MLSGPNMFFLDWRGKRLTLEEQYIVREAAADVIRLMDYGINFTSDVIKGVVVRIGEGYFGAPGTFFRAYMGGEGADRRECTFLLPRGSEARRYCASRPLTPAEEEALAATAAAPPPAQASERAVPQADLEKWRHITFSADMPKPTVAVAPSAIN